MPTRRSAAVAIAVTLQKLIEGKTASWTADQELVLSALRRSTSSLSDASTSELGEYLRDLDPSQLRGVAANVKGIFHEMLVVRAENLDGDTVTARIFEQTNHPGADIEFVIDGDVIGEVQLKAVQDPAAIAEHFARYPDVDVLATSEVYAATEGAYAGRLTASGVSNDEIAALTQDTLEDLAGESLDGFIQDGIITSVLVSGALQARAVLQGKAPDARQVRSTLELLGVGAGTAATMDVLLNLA
ncbi:hypothetical protein SAMN04488020_102149 [Palleronia marisminoris]|uniref:Uncharacterized protein n=1 Tax=Palleronia marisminoris TaxID=315423 RepID=A0A1Y5RY43_9RHOB|nr:hypothetical protein [Palleronia marisminoris]SFG41136.1 hypothetical protein SAMN04488020_102149 [Palleronia marisminoris]SLN28255.1 hypothetical protein PAM7066_01131 [Palleronia marisminoris]